MLKLSVNNDLTPVGDHMVRVCSVNLSRSCVVTCLNDCEVVESVRGYVVGSTEINV